MCANTKTSRLGRAAFIARFGARTRLSLGFGIASAAGIVFAELLLGREAPLAFGFAAAWWIAVVVIIRSDLDRLIIPDGATAAVAVLGIAYALAGQLMGGAGLGVAMDHAALAALTGACAFGLFWVVARTYRRLSGREGLGFGDVKLAGASALWLAPADANLALEIAAFAGLAVLLWRRRRGAARDTALPFGAFLAPAAWLAFVLGPALHGLVEPLG